MDQRDLKPYIERALEFFGETTNVWGATGRCACWQVHTLECSSLSSRYYLTWLRKIRNRIFGENAAEFYRLTPME